MKKTELSHILIKLLKISDKELLCKTGNYLKTKMLWDAQFLIWEAQEDKMRREKKKERKGGRGQHIGGRSKLPDF